MNMQQRRDAQLPYISDESVMEEQRISRGRVQQLNSTNAGDFEAIQKAAMELLQTQEPLFICPPFYCDYGHHIKVGKNFFCNYNCTILDVAPVTFGDNCLLAPNVAIYTAGHPLHPDSRNSAWESGIEVTVGDNVWIGGNVVICPGVHIGSNCVIGAGSVVTRDIPDWSLAAGNPCRVIRKITEEDRPYYFRDRKFDEASWQDIQKKQLG